ncbi:MAG: hypothetical protein KAW12_01875 [Candidatus Aminicenantes bacterium]|nr:hypothetical protein [Candidatus Aminicenantes bacterium]
MKKTTVLIIFLMIISLAFFYQCKCKEPAQENEGVSVLPKALIAKVSAALSEKCGPEHKERIEKGVRQVARLWKKNDGSDSDFEKFCTKNLIVSEEERELVFNKFSFYFEALWGHFNRITLDLKSVLDLDAGPVHNIDRLFGSYGVDAHLEDDFYANKIAFVSALNFPFYSLEEKKKSGPDWSRKEWAYARMGDVFPSRMPAEIKQNYNEVSTATDIYIADYNIFMGHVLNEKGEKIFPADMKLLVHWNLRDELKANYGVDGGLEKQEIIYEVMQHIVSQEIPRQVINNSELEWDPFDNKVYKEGKEIEFQPEKETRYEHLLNNFLAIKAMDRYNPPGMETFIKAAFDGGMEISQPEVEARFAEFASSPVLKQVAELIKKRLNRDLKPFDIWYDGFKARSGINEEELNRRTRAKYPTAAALEKDLPNILLKLGFPGEKAAFLASKITVDPARGSGHAWGANMKAEKAHLRTRVPAGGMNYKGYNIAIHEFGHNVEQTISLHDVDYYMMQGVPNTAFTEALAFLFQARDLELLGMEETDPNKDYLYSLDTVWSAYEIMGISLVDMAVWKWMYDNPETTPGQLKEAVIKISKDVWNKYFAPVYGMEDQPILGIYSHMIAYPLYLSAYAYGELIKFQVKQFIAGKDFAKEVERMFSAGKLIPQLWMKNAVGEEISIEPLLQAAEEALKHIK